MRPIPMRSLLAATVVLLGTATGVSRGAEPPANVEFTPDVVYGKAGDVELKLNLARPKNPDQGAKLPCVLVIHGGGWRHGNREQHNDITWELARRGYAAATVSYRLVPTAQFPAQINDVKCAVRFLRASAEKYGIDPDRIGAVGFSAGAHLSMLLAVTGKDDNLEGDGGSPEQSSAIQAAVSFFGPTDLARDDLPEVVQALVKEFVGSAPAPGDEKCRKASPITYVGKGDAPMLLFQGTADRLVPYNQALLMAEAMAKAGVGGRVELLMNADHGWGGEELKRTAEATFAFFAEHLKAK